MSNTDVWTRLADVGIYPCVEHDSFEIDRHNEPTTSKSYFFDCLNLDEVYNFSGVYVTIDRKNKCEIEIEGSIEFPNTHGMLTNSIVNDLCTKLEQKIRIALTNNGEV